MLLILFTNPIFGAPVMETFLAGFSDIPQIRVDARASFDSRGFVVPGSLEKNAYLQIMRQVPGLSRVARDTSTFPKWQGIVNRYFTITPSNPVLSPLNQQVIGQTYVATPRPNMIPQTINIKSPRISGGPSVRPTPMTVNIQPTISPTIAPEINPNIRVRVTGGVGSTVTGGSASQPVVTIGSPSTSTTPGASSSVSTTIPPARPSLPELPRHSWPHSTTLPHIINSSTIFTRPITFAQSFVTTSNITLPAGVEVPRFIQPPQGGTFNVVNIGNLQHNVIPVGSRIAAGAQLPVGTVIDPRFEFPSRTTFGRVTTPASPSATYSPPAKSVLFKGALLYGAVSGLNSAIIEYQTSFEDDGSFTDVLVAGFSTFALRTATVFVGSLAVTSAVSALASRSATVNSVASGVSRFANPVGLGLLIGTVTSSVAINVTDSKIFNDIPNWGTSYSFPVQRLSELDAETGLLFSGDSSLGTSSKDFRLIVNIDSIPNSMFFLGNSGHELIPSYEDDSLLIIPPGGYRSVPGQYVVSVDGISAKALTGFEIYKNLAENPTGWERFGRGFFDILSGGVSNNRRDSQLAVANAMIPLLRENLLRGVQYFVYSTNEIGELDLFGSGDCLIDRQTNQINCDIRGRQLEEEGFYLFLIRVKFMDSELLHFYSAGDGSQSYSFENDFEQDRLCGFFPRFDVSQDISDLVCRLNLAGIYDYESNQYTSLGSQEMTNFKQRLDSEIHELRNNYPSIVRRFIEGFELQGNNIYQLYNRFDAGNVELKHSNTVNTFGYPIFGIFTVGSPVINLEDIVISDDGAQLIIRFVDDQGNPYPVIDYYRTEGLTNIAIDELTNQLRIYDITSGSAIQISGSASISGNILTISSVTGTFSEGMSIEVQHPNISDAIAVLNIRKVTN